MTNEVPLMEIADDNIVLFRPHVPASAADSVAEVLSTRWVGQGPKVDLFESKFGQRFSPSGSSIAVGSGTDALHLAYLLAGIGPGDEVIVPVFTCTATNLPLLYIGAKPVFADIDPKTLNIDVEHVQELVSERTKAIVCVDYAGLPCDMAGLRKIAAEYGIPLIEDAAQALGATYDGVPVGSVSDFTVFSFQAIKHITTGDGGMLTFSDNSKLELAKRLRWFGIDRTSKQLGVWENDIKEIGYKYQMTDIGAAMGLAGLAEFDEILSLRRTLLKRYESGLSNIPFVQFLGYEPENVTHAAWLATIAVENRRELQRKLLSHNIETNQVHYRNDRYSVFGGRQGNLPNMDLMEEKYLCLPLHTKMTISDVDRIIEVIASGW